MCHSQLCFSSPCVSLGHGTSSLSREAHTLLSLATSQLPQDIPQAFPEQLRDMSSPACPRSSLNWRSGHDWQAPVISCHSCDCFFRKSQIGETAGTPLEHFLVSFILCIDQLNSHSAPTPVRLMSNLPQGWAGNLTDGNRCLMRCLGRHSLSKWIGTHMFILYWRKPFGKTHRCT